MKLGFQLWLAIILGGGGLVIATIAMIMSLGIWGALIAVILFGFIGSILWAVVFKPIALSRKLSKNGVSATARILEVNDTGVTVNENPQVKFKLEVTPANGLPFTVEMKQVVSRLQTSLFMPGNILPVVYDPNDKSSIMIADGSSQPAEADRVMTGPWAGISKEESYRRLLEMDKNNKEILAIGISSRAIVTKYTWMGVYVNGQNPLAELDVEVLPQDKASFKATVKGVITDTSVPKFQPGEEIFVKYDPHNNTRITIEHS